MQSKLQSLTKFVATAHESQVRKYTGEPYISHLLNVANLADHHSIVFGYEIGLCHDIFEDTDVKDFQLRRKLIELGYTRDETKFIVDSVWELTDVFTKEKFPQLNREKRKRLEAERLWTICPNSQSVKYCDMFDNLSTITLYDPDFAIIYKKEKDYILRNMYSGDQLLFSKVVTIK